MFKFKQTKNMAKTTPEVIEKINQALGIIGSNAAKAYCPVLTGRARNSISWMTGGGVGAGILSTFVPPNAVIVGSNVDYFPNIEFGARKRAAKPTLGPSMQNVTKGLSQAEKAAAKVV